jgi:hypothetical protein
MKYAVWPNGSFCELDEVHEMTHLSDDYTVAEIDAETAEEIELAVEHIVNA